MACIIHYSRPSCRHPHFICIGRNQARSPASASCKASYLTVQNFYTANNFGEEGFANSSIKSGFCGRIAWRNPKRRSPAGGNGKACTVKSKPLKGCLTPIHPLRNFHPLTSELPLMHFGTSIHGGSERPTNALLRVKPCKLPSPTIEVWECMVGLLRVEPCKLPHSARPFDRRYGEYVPVRAFPAFGDPANHATKNV